MEEWKTYKLGDLIKIKYGKDHKSLADGNYPAYGSGGVMRMVERPIYDKPSILIPRKGSLNNIIYTEKPFWTVDTMFWTIIDTKLVLPHYLYYTIKDVDFASLNVGSAVPSLTCPIIEAIEVSIPCIETQKMILNCIEPLDSKIELNNRINHNLEEQAQALYKSWFVDFEPFKDGKFVESELGMIPEGWRVVTMGEVTTEIRTKVGNRTGIKVLSPINTGKLALSEEYFTKQVFSNSIAKYILVEPNSFAYNPARVNIGSIGMNEFPFAGCVSPVYVVFRCEDEYEYLFDFFRKGERFKTEVITRSIGGVRQTLAYKDFSMIKMVYPPAHIIRNFNSIYHTFYRKINDLENQNKKISELRDTILPKLMSGELKINEIDC